MVLGLARLFPHRCCAAPLRLGEGPGARAVHKRIYDATSADGTPDATPHGKFGSWCAWGTLNPAANHNRAGGCATLMRAGAPTDDVRVENAHCVPARETCLSYIADVVLPGEYATGRLACVGPWHACTLTMAEFGLRATPVPAVGQPNPWVARINEIVQQSLNWARALVRG